MTARRLPVLQLHTEAVLSELPVATREPSAENTTEGMSEVWPSMVARHWPVLVSHSLAVVSPLAVASLLESGLKLRA
eukprot:scaffold177820_cov34-Prasinocladus_malaysianus.AAC.1